MATVGGILAGNGWMLYVYIFFCYLLHIFWFTTNRCHTQYDSHASDLETNTTPRTDLSLLTDHGPLYTESPFNDHEVRSSGAITRP